MITVMLLLQHRKSLFNFSSVKARKFEDESHWVVGLDANNIFCILCKTPQSYPQVCFFSC